MLSSTEPTYVTERKFSGDRTSFAAARDVLCARCVPDGEYPLGHINSVYFDTPRMRSYEEKANGDHLKMKVRLRWYGEDEALAPEVPAFLELKYRIGSARYKVRTEVQAPRSLLLETHYDHPDWADFLASFSKELDEPLSLGWTPVVQISYDRERYVDAPSGSRVSIDWNICTPRVNTRVFPGAFPVQLDAMVCEFKNRFGRPPLWSETMRNLGLRLTSFSKYGECMRRLLAGEP